MGLLEKHKKAFFGGAIFGFLAPFIGLFFGLQISTTLGNILTFPLQIVSRLTETPFGELSWFWLLLGWVFSMLLWGWFFVVIARNLIKSGS